MMEVKTMEWVRCDDESVEIPWTKVCIWDGGNTFWAYLQKIEIVHGNRKLIWNVITPEDYGECTLEYWMEITEPNK